MNAQKRPLKQGEHRREAERLIEARRAEFEATKAIIEEQRKLMIQEHAAKMHAYLPPGTLMTEEDLEYFPAEIRDEIKGRLEENRGQKQFGLKQTIDSYT